MAEERNLELDNEVLRRTIAQLQADYGVMATERAELAVRNGMIADKYNELNKAYSALEQTLNDFKAKLTPNEAQEEEKERKIIVPLEEEANDTPTEV